MPADRVIIDDPFDPDNPYVSPLTEAERAELKKWWEGAMPTRLKEQLRSDWPDVSR